uniref:Tyrosine--tRNA ligase n=1 Tax=Strongyloides stercoralis TaxID=6248 RepID=A0AAF5CRE6_STRER
MISKYTINVIRKINSQTGIKSPLIQFCQDLQQRDLLSTSHPGEILSNEGILLKDLPPTLYSGFDPTANSLHIGHLFILNGLFRSSKLFNCKPIALIGEATALIGDPSGRNSERPQLPKEEVSENSIAIKNQILKIHSNANINSNVELEVINNMDWYKDMSMIDYLRLSKKFRVGEMMRLGAIKDRLDDNFGISFTEFAYQTLQSYDFYILSQTKDCFFQIGGSDQLGHINSGYNYIKRCTKKLSGGVCLPLLTDASGNKLGKSSAGHSLWLDSEKTSPYAFYQFFMQLHDDIAEKMLLSLSLNDIDRIKEIIENHRNNLGKYVAQQSLAEEMTILVHGENGLDLAKRCSNILFRGNISDVDYISETELEKLFGPSSFKISKSSTLTYGQLASSTRNDKIKGEQLMTKGAFKITILKPIFGEQVNYKIFRLLSLIQRKLTFKKSKNVSIQNNIIGGVSCRIYVPKKFNKSAIIFIHGGGFITLHPENYELPCIEISKKSQSIIISIDYSLSPEKKFPTAIEECENVINEFCTSYYKRYDIDKENISIMGDSAGGNLAAVSCLRLARKGKSNFIKKNILIYPTTSSLNFLSPSYLYYYEKCNNSALLSPQMKANILKFYFPIKLSKLDNKKILLNGHVSNDLRSLDFMSPEILPIEWRNEIDNYIQSIEPDEELCNKFRPFLTNPDFSPIMATYDELSKFPKTIIFTCGCDILRDEGYLFYKKLEKSNVNVQWKHYEDGIHGALNIVKSKSQLNPINRILDGVEKGAQAIKRRARSLSKDAERAVETIQIISNESQSLVTQFQNVLLKEPIELEAKNIRELKIIYMKIFYSILSMLFGQKMGEYVIFKIFNQLIDTESSILLSYIVIPVIIVLRYFPSLNNEEKKEKLCERNLYIYSIFIGMVLGFVFIRTQIDTAISYGLINASILFLYFNTPEFVLSINDKNKNQIINIKETQTALIILNILSETYIKTVLSLIN